MPGAFRGIGTGFEHLSAAGARAYGIKIDDVCILSPDPAMTSSASPPRHLPGNPGVHHRSSCCTHRTEATAPAYNLVFREIYMNSDSQPPVLARYIAA